MVMVLGGVILNPKISIDPRPAFTEAYNIAAPVLDELSFTYDQPLPVAHALLVGIPSGAITVTLPRPPKMQAIDSTTHIAARCPVAELQQATALYREGVSSTNPFHQFLALWKAYENADEVRRGWRTKRGHKASDKKLDTVVACENFPDLVPFRGHAGKSFGAVKEHLRKPYRCAIAHGTSGDHGPPKTAAAARDYNEVMLAVPIIRHMARVTLTNTRATLLSGMP